MKVYDCPCGCGMLSYVFKEGEVYIRYPYRNHDVFICTFSYIEEMGDIYLVRSYKRYLKEKTIINYKGDL